MVKISIEIELALITMLFGLLLIGDFGIGGNKEYSTTSPS